MASEFDVIVFRSTVASKFDVIAPKHMTRDDPKAFNPPIVGWIQTPIQIRFRGGQKQVQWIQGRVDSENIARYRQIWMYWIATTNCKIIGIGHDFVGAKLVKLCAMEA